ncbi:hypothetical protein GQ55_6G223200 [Panicum hallii var. hallii]|uniref:Uncharacterized protein n=1 Tax=Panicum hallii var. hallii TaxID=1504633 RepID=A0A2T7D8D8_9POAL|nr:hypothetical protein GQ55_6G223200 [Panicum hallii var. hallii]
MDNLAFLRGITAPVVAGAVLGALDSFMIRYEVWIRLLIVQSADMPQVCRGSNFFELLVKLWSPRGNVVSSAYTAGAVGLLVQEALTDNGLSCWTGVAGGLHCVLVLIGLIYWTCHRED